MARENRSGMERRMPGTAIREHVCSYRAERGFRLVVMQCGDSIVEEPVRLVCPQCELIYRLKRYTPGKAYNCKNCGGQLVDADARDAADSDDSARFALSAPRAAQADAGPGESTLTRLPKLIEELSNRLDILKQLELGDQDSGPAAKILEVTERLEGSLREANGELEHRISELEQKLDARIDGVLGGDLREFRDDVRDRLGALDSLRTGLDSLQNDLSARLSGLDSLRSDLDERLSGLGTAQGDLATHLSGIDSSQSDIRTRLSLLDSFQDDVKTRLGGLDSRQYDLKAGLDGINEYQRTVMARLSELEQKLSGMLDDTADTEALAALRAEMNEGRGELLREFLARLELHGAAQTREIGALFAPVAEDVRSNTTVEVDIDELADRLVAGVRGHGSLVDEDSRTVVDAVAKLADELVKEQGANTAQMEKLAEEIRNAVAGIAMLEEWRTGLPARVADEIGQTIESRVVGPISAALARQAPAILSELQDSKLVDIVSRSVREAQRPLLREILAGSRAGMPVWLFLSILLPLLFIIGYLFLPGEFTINDVKMGQDDIAARLEDIESGGFSLSREAEARLDTLRELNESALAHARAAGGQEERIKNLSAQLTAQNQSIKQYEEVLQNQTRKLRLYEMKLVQLGVSPASVAE